MEPLYNVYYVTPFLGDQMRVGTMFNGEIIINLFEDMFETIHSVKDVRCVVVTRTRGMDLHEMFNPT